MNAQQPITKSVIVGLGKTGLSVARYLASKNCEFSVVDSRDAPPNADDLKKDYADVQSHYGSFNSTWFDQADQLIVNPGIAIATPEIHQASQLGTEIIGDIELFAREVSNTKSIIAITGSNGKTTVTMLLDLMAKKSGVKVGAGGNIGTPALDLLIDDQIELYVLELSSFQLETTSSLQTKAAVILNISEDHLDRYDNDIKKYADAKAVIYNNCQQVICNRDDLISMRLVSDLGIQQVTSFGLNKPEENDYGIDQRNGQDWLVKGNQFIMVASEIKLPGQHNVSNALAAIALGETVGLKMSAMLEVLREFSGMEHRTEWLVNIEGIDWYNDSKGTNVGATLAALSGLPGKTVLIAGGQGKGADFLPLKKVIAEKAHAVVLMGEDATKIAEFVDASISVVYVNSMKKAVEKSYELAKGIVGQGNVLLSPACASFDMFDNYVARGMIFTQEVEELQMNLAGGEND